MVMKKWEKREQREREAQAEQQRIANEDFVRRGRAFRLELQALCLKHGVTLTAHANPSSNVSCYPEIEIIPLKDGETPELLDRYFDEASEETTDGDDHDTEAA
jgi:hypothetical protein